MSLRISTKSWLIKMDPKNTEHATTSLTDTTLHLHYKCLRDTINCPMQICRSPVNVLEISDY